jgi:hypothetical protein
MRIGIYCKIMIYFDGLFRLTFLHLRSMSVNRFGSLGLFVEFCLFVSLSRDFRPLSDLAPETAWGLRICGEALAGRNRLKSRRRDVRVER